MVLMNEVPFCINGKKIYDCENKVSREDKIEFLDKMNDGIFSYYLQLAEKYEKEKDDMPKDKWGNVKTVSLKAWIKRNDTRSSIDDNYRYGSLRKSVGRGRYIQNINQKGGYDVYEDFVDQMFHRQLSECEAMEKNYFKEHDEYSILKSDLRVYVDKRGNIFNVIMCFDSDGDIYIYEEGNHNNKREITIDEIKLLLEKYDELEQYIDKLRSEVKVEL